MAKAQQNDKHGIFIDGILRVHYSSDFITFFVCILHKFAFSQIIQDGLEFQILGTI